MDTHIPLFETVGAQTWHRCSKCAFVVVMSFDPEYVAVIVTPGDPNVQHIAHGQMFLPNGLEPALVAVDTQSRTVGHS